MEIGLENKIYDGGAFFYFDPPGDSDPSFYEYANIPAEFRNFKNFRIKNNADDYEITCSIVVRESFLGVSPEEETEFFEFEVELFRIFWEEGSYATKTNSYYDHWWNWRQIPGWKSLEISMFNRAWHSSCLTKLTTTRNKYRKCCLQKP